ncbi:MAG: class I SAM-dependent methyltransferase [Minisyncoccota bacterium]
MIQDAVEFYDKESGHYTTKRYPKVTLSYTQYVFKKRLEIFLNQLVEIEKKLPRNATVLEIGCADGIVFKAIEERFPNRFSKMIGIDVSPKMINEAKNNSRNSRESFFLRDDFKLEKFDLIIELGIHPYDLEGELKYVNTHLNSNGFYFYSAVGKKSAFVLLKLNEENYLDDYKPYKKYEEIFCRQFEVINNKPYGFFIPKLWAVPFLGRLLQPVFDSVFSKIAPELFHEKIYCLKKLD